VFIFERVHFIIALDRKLLDTPAYLVGGGV